MAGETVNDTQIGLRRAAEMAAVFMIGDGLLGVLQPERHVALWRSNVGAVDALVRPFGGNAGRRRAYGLLQIVAGVVLASRQRPAEESQQPRTGAGRPTPD
jgi:hypothetical protein